MSLSPGTMSQNLSVLAVHRTMTLSTPLLSLKSRMSLRICSTWDAGRGGGRVSSVAPPRCPFVPSPVPPCQDLLGHGASQDVVRPLLLVGGDEFGDVDGRSGLHLLHVGPELLLQRPLQHLRPPHGLGQVQRGDVPAWGTRRHPRARGAPRRWGSPPCPTYHRRRCRWGAPWAAGPGRARRHHPRGRCPGTRWRLGAGSRSNWLSGMGQARMGRWQGEEGSQHAQNRGLGLQSPSTGAGRRLGCRTLVQLSLVSPSLWDTPEPPWGFSGDTPGTRPLQGSL